MKLKKFNEMFHGEDLYEEEPDDDIDDDFEEINELVENLLISIESGDININKIENVGFRLTNPNNNMEAYTINLQQEPSNRAIIRDIDGYGQKGI